MDVAIEFERQMTGRKPTVGVKRLGSEVEAKLC